jgi:hypothetical protein
LTVRFGERALRGVKDMGETDRPMVVSTPGTSFTVVRCFRG